LSMDLLPIAGAFARFPVLWSAVYGGGAGRGDADAAPG
jgi:hypothetical protein